MRQCTDPAVRRPARAVRALLGGLAASAVVIAGGLTALPASAAPTAPPITVVSGDRVLTAAWGGVAGAASYTVRVSTSKSLAKAKVLTTSATSIRIPKLRNGRPYYIGVTASGPGLITPAVVRTRTVKAAAGSGVPLPVTSVTAEPGDQPNTVRVSWTGGGRANKVAVIAGSSVITNERSFNSGWYPATTRSITVTVPERYRPYLGAGSGNPVWVKVVQSNASSRSFGPSYSYERKYRPSPVGTWAFARAAVPEAPNTRLKVAELNTQSVGATARYSAENRWAQRAPRVATAVNKADPDLLLTAELATNVLGSCTNHPGKGDPYTCRNRTQVADLAHRLDGLRLAGGDAYDRVIDRMRDAKRWNTKVTNGAHVFYDPEKLTLIDHGYFAPAMTPGESFGNVTGLGVGGWDGSEPVGADRWLSWAQLETKDDAHRRFFAVAAHFPVGDAASVVRVRAELGRKLVPAIDRLAGDLPVVLGADLNSDPVRSPQAPQVSFLQAGWFDAAAVAEKRQRSGMKVSTANGSGAQDKGADPGYGSKPVKHPYETSRIDYILLRKSPYTYSYANVLNVQPNGHFVKALQGTDHNMQLATIGIGDPVR